MDRRRWRTTPPSHTEIEKICFLALAFAFPGSLGVLFFIPAIFKAYTPPPQDAGGEHDARSLDAKMMIIAAC